jgi:hypothetical protein
MYAVKNLCRKTKTYADVYIADGVGDVWARGLETAYTDLYELVYSQPYVNSFVMGIPEGDYIDLNKWRVRVANTHASNGVYDTPWSELLSQEYGFDIPQEYAWLKCYKKNFDTEGCVVIHNSVGHGGGLPYDKVFQIPCKEFLFVTSNIEEWNVFKYKNRVKLYLVGSVSDMASAINSCKLFVGNQSAPLALASALDVPRIGDLNPDPAPFYMGEEKYSDSFMWYLNNKTNYVAL